MTRPIAVLRPEPGNAVTAKRIEAAGLAVIRLPLFATRALAWEVPDASSFDALLLTSANAARFGGAGLRRLATLPLYTVGEATADAARGAGLTPVFCGERDGRALLAAARLQGMRRALLLAGRERALDAGGIIARAIAVYASDPLPVDRAAPDALSGAVALVHSARAAERLAELVGAGRAHIRIAVISQAAAAAAGPGWAGIATATVPTDAALIAAAAMLAD